MAADLITLIETVAITQFLTPGAKSLGEAALERGQRMAKTAVQLLKNVGRKPQPVEPKLLVPLVQKAALETNEAFSDMWAALLANAADPAQGVTVQPGFVEVLPQLTSDDALVLLFIQHEHELSHRILKGDVDNRLKVKEVFAHFAWSDARLTISLDNLLRLRLAEPLTQATYGPTPAINPGSVIRLTTFGSQFLKACAPPTV